MLRISLWLWRAAILIPVLHFLLHLWGVPHPEVMVP